MKTAMLLVTALIVALIVGIWFYFIRTAPPEILPPPKIESISPAEAKRRIDAGEKAVLLDVRTPEEYEEIHIPGSVFVPLNPAGTFAERVREALPDRDVAVFAFCRSGQRSLSAAEIMAGNGYSKVFNLGGTLDWPYEVVKAEKADGEPARSGGR